MPLKPTGLFLTTTLLVASHATGDVTADLLNTLNDLDSDQHLTAELTTELWQTPGDGPETQGATTLTLDDGPDGFQVLYGNTLLDQMQEEQQALAHNPDALTPTLDTLDHVSSIEMRTHLNSANELSRHLKEATFIGEETVTYNGTPTRRLTFEKGLDTVSEDERDYIKEFDYRMDVWVSETGLPLKTETQVYTKGRFMVVIKFEYAETTSAEYAVANGRLVTLRYERKYEATGFGDGEQVRSRRTLTLQ